MDEQMALQQAVVAVHAGQKAEARQLLAKVLQANPRHEQAWLWMSAVVESDAERVRCLQQVLAINSDNTVARKGLAQFQAHAGIPPQPVSQPASVAPAGHRAGEPSLWPIPEPPPLEQPLQSDPKPKPRSRSKRPGMAVAIFAILAVLALCLVGGGGLLYWGIFVRSESAHVPIVPTLTPTVEAQVGLVATHSPTPVSHTPTSLPPTSTAIPAPTSTPSLAPTLPPLPTPCAIAAASRFAAAWGAYAEQLGCAMNQAHAQVSASQDFERGFLLWREDPDQVYVMYDDGRLGIYPMSVYPESMRLNPPGADPSIVPPPGLIQPVRGFGLIWRDNPEVRDGVGWALENEARADWYYKFMVQDFAGGAILHECRMGVRVLPWDGAWFQVGGGESCD